MLEPGREVVALTVVEASQVGEARRQAGALAGRLGFDALGQGKVALLVSELASNLVKHAREGRMVVQGIGWPTDPGVEILALDRGPGVAEFARCLADGYSTRGTMGVGLGSASRQADHFDWYSVPGEGTVIATRMNLPRRAADPRPAGPHPPLDLAAVCVPLAGESECGDAWAIEPIRERLSALIVADGLGHGPMAAKASAAAVAEFRRHPTLAPAAQLQALHAAIRGTRGASVLVVELDHERGRVRAAGVGNIAGSVLTADGSRGMVSHNGTVGVALTKTQEFLFDCPPGSLLVIHSDGIDTRWRLPIGSPLRDRGPAVIAGAIFRDHRRERDDATVLVARAGGPAR